MTLVLLASCTLPASRVCHGSHVCLDKAHARPQENIIQMTIGSITAEPHSMFPNLMFYLI
jgi:hypothetical protein